MDIMMRFNNNLFPVVMLFILYFDARKDASEPQKLFRLVILLTIGTLLAEAVSWIPDGQTYSFARPMAWFTTILYMALAGMVPFSWLLYAYSKIYDGENLLRERKKLFILSLPLLVYLLFLVITPWTHLFFTIDSQNLYQRKSLFFIPYLISGGYTLATGIFSCIHLVKEVSRQKKKECLYLVIFIILPLIGNLLQAILFGWSIAWPFVSLSILIVYLNIQNQQIEVDCLTGLNNRGQFDRYLRSKYQHAHAGDTWCLIMLDIDDFKRINDLYGHIVGDEALWQTASILREAFDQSNAFVARYGGDEFAVILDCRDAEEASRRVDTLHRASARLNGQGNHPYSLSFSVGYAMYRPTDGMENLIASADRRMYEQKKKQR